EREGVAQPLLDLPRGELREAAAAPPDEVSPERAVAYDALERRGDRIRRFVAQEQARVAERPGDRPGGVRDDRKIRAHRLEERDAEAYVIGEREERRRAAVIGHELLHGEAARERDRVLEPAARDVPAQVREVLRGHRGRADEIEARAGVALAV